MRSLRRSREAGLTSGTAFRNASTLSMHIAFEFRHIGDVNCLASVKVGSPLVDQCSKTIVTFGYHFRQPRCGSASVTVARPTYAICFRKQRYSSVVVRILTSVSRSSSTVTEKMRSEMTEGKGSNKSEAIHGDRRPNAD